MKELGELAWCGQDFELSGDETSVVETFVPARDSEFPDG